MGILKQLHKIRRYVDRFLRFHHSNEWFALKMEMEQCRSVMRQCQIHMDSSRNELADTPPRLHMESVAPDDISPRFNSIGRRFDEVWERIDKLERIINDSGLIHISGRLDVRLIRLEVLMYYLHPDNLERLDGEAKEIIHRMWLDYDYEISQSRVFPPDPFYENVHPTTYNWQGGTGMASKPPSAQQDENGFYVSLRGRKLYLPHSREWADEYMRQIFETIDNLDSPHVYLNPQDDGIDIPDGAILADIGAAEGYFGFKYLDRCRKVYFFESESVWLETLHKSLAPYRDKIEIIKGRVGDQPGDIRLDDFFAGRPDKPNFIKMDIEGAEGAVLRGMPGLLLGPDPLTLLVCTYHRQEDWDNYYAMLCKHFTITSSNGYYWHVSNVKPPFLRRGVMRAVKNT